jgi:PIN domain nuclease of toxin-antitoxin system
MMGTLLDTHALIWWVGADDRITPALRQRLNDPAEEVFVSAASAWEIATKVRLGKLRPPDVLLQNFLQAVEALGFLALPISLHHGYEAGMLTSLHRDPFDRMLAAQARAEDLVLASADPAFRTLGVTTVW